MSKNKNKKQKSTLTEKAFITWLRYDPLVSVIVGNDDRIRRDVMLNLLGTKATQRHFGQFPPRKPEEGPIYPSTVREAIEKSLQDGKKRSKLIKDLVFWATDPATNNHYIKSHLTRKQIVTSLLGPLFFHATANQEESILKGLKYMLVKKQTAIGVPGEQSFEVNHLLLDRITDILIHNQKVIINKAVTEAEEKMRVHLLRQIQNLRGEKLTTPYLSKSLKTSLKKIVKEKFPLSEQSVKHFEEMLEFYTHSKWPELAHRAHVAKEKIVEIRKPLTLTAQDDTR